MTTPIDAAGNLFSIPCPACGKPVGKPCGHGSVGMYVCQARIVALQARTVRLSERPPRQNTFGSLYDKESDLRYYCWILESRVVTPDGEEVLGWSLASRSTIHPNHFKTADGATKERDRRTTEMIGSTLQQAVKFEYRVAPKYLGYIPEGGETWLA